jgi:hypothetical protein
MSSRSDFRRPGRRLVLAAPLALAAAAARAQGDVAFERSSLVIAAGGRDLKFEIELALTEPQRERGLMYRKQLGPYEGMLFDFHREMPVSFWMKNTLIPLDMVFIGADGVVKHVHANAVPLSTDTVPSMYPVRAVLEINGGSARLLGIKPGDTVKHPIFGNA